MALHKKCKKARRDYKESTAWRNQNTCALDLLTASKIKTNSKPKQGNRRNITAKNSKKQPKQGNMTTFI
jgi:hypothetical protein